MPRSLEVWERDCRRSLERSRRRRAEVEDPGVPKRLWFAIVVIVIAIAVAVALMMR